jgi:zinc and cadmium transporter
MKAAHVQAILSVVIVTLLPLLGLAGLAFSQRTLDRLKLALTGFAAGALLGDSFIHLLPETYSRFRNQIAAGLLCSSGLLLFFLLDKMIRFGKTPSGADTKNVPLLAIALTGTSLHNFMDGLLIGASYLVSPIIGFTTTIAVVLHEIPHELGDIGVLLQGGLPIRGAIKLNFVCGLSAPVGTAAALLAAGLLSSFSVYLLPVAAGSFLYLSGSVLLPLLFEQSGVRNTAAQFALMALGVGIMALLALRE